MKEATPLIPRRQGKGVSSNTSSRESSNQLSNQSSNQSDQFVADVQGTQQHAPRVSTDSAVKVEEVVAVVESKQDVSMETPEQPHVDSNIEHPEVSVLTLIQVDLQLFPCSEIYLTQRYQFWTFL